MHTFEIVIKRTIPEVSILPSAHQEHPIIDCKKSKKKKKKKKNHTNHKNIG